MTIIGRLGDSFPQFDGQGSYHQDVWSTLDKHCQDVRYTKIHPVHPRPDDIQKFKNINTNIILLYNISVTNISVTLT